MEQQITFIDQCEHQLSLIHLNLYLSDQSPRKTFCKYNQIKSLLLELVEVVKNIKLSECRVSSVHN